MTDKQRRLLLYIREYYGIHGAPPDYTEMGEHMDTYRENITPTVNSLIKQGYLRKLRRGIVIPSRKKLPLAIVT
jgi:DNA-binding MarR family transcriptional regulator